MAAIAQASTLLTARQLQGLAVRDIAEPRGTTARRVGPIRATASQQQGCGRQSAASDGSTRRDVLIGSLAVPLATSLAGVATAAEGTADYVPYANDQEKYQLLVPSGWAQSEGSSGTRKVMAFHPEDRLDANVSILITLLSADFTSLGSFGTVDAFAESLVNSLDRSWQKKPGQKAVLLAAKAADDKYYVEYTVQKPDEARVHLFSVVATGRNGWYNNLYTVTAQYPDDEAAAFKPTIDKVVKSFRLTL
eukprot:TRINITY_DN26249_c0_g1_i1.p1 TRINITY_DN26249_c0_g1~~TRINITY_DN26249_c0_g1_i1.p1  ORF type:complete len:249 (-),score=19.48 TRINITY_DN26249_c0_g1_i1:183-929(-)